MRTYSNRQDNLSTPISKNKVHSLLKNFIKFHVVDGVAKVVECNFSFVVFNTKVNMVDVSGLRFVLIQSVPGVHADIF